VLDKVEVTLAVLKKCDWPWLIQGPCFFLRVSIAYFGAQSRLCTTASPSGA